MPKTAPWVRPASPLGASTLITSAPHSPRTRPTVGAAKNCVRSITLIPDNISLAIFFSKTIYNKED